MTTQNQSTEHSAAYDMIDRFLRNNLGDDDYAEYSAALDALTAPPTQPAQCVPGWKLVPIEPTKEMVLCALQAENINWISGENLPQQIYAAMLAATPAPAPAQEPAEVTLTDDEIEQGLNQNDQKLIGARHGFLIGAKWAIAALREKEAGNAD